MVECVEFQTLIRREEPVTVSDNCSEIGVGGMRLYMIIATVSRVV